jgi:hypothetical protein
MQAVLEKSVGIVEEFISKLDSADNKIKNEIENRLVSMGSNAIPELIDQLQVVRGIKRGVVAMTLIRIGESSIKYLKQAARNNKDFQWVAEYLISEINCKAA